MKTYCIKYAYNHGQIESDYTIQAESREEALEIAESYTGRVISVKEETKEKKTIAESTINYAMDVLKAQREYIQLDKRGTCKMTSFESIHARTNDMHYTGPNYYGRPIIIDAAELSPNRFEIMATWEGGNEVETVTVSTLEQAQTEYARMVEYHTTGKASGMYTRADWECDRSFSAAPGQEIDPEIYDEMFNILPPYSLPRCFKLNCLIQDGFMLGEAYDFDPETKKLRYMAFSRRNGHCFYEGLFSR